MGKSKKLSLPKKYAITTKKSEFLHLINSPHSNEFANIVINDQEVSFLSNYHVEVHDGFVINRYQQYVRNYIYKNLIGIICFILIILTLAISNYFIREIAFADENTKNSDVLQTVESYLTKVGPFKVLNDDITSISRELRTKYHQYAWIGLTRRGGKLVIEIQEQSVYPEQFSESNSGGDFVALNDAVICEILVEKGVVLVNLNQTVQKGDILVSGNLKYHINPSDHSNTIHPRGYIIATSISYKQITIPKVASEICFTGKTHSYFRVSWFNNPYRFIKSPYEEYHIKEDVIFSIGSFCTFLKINAYEKASMMIEYDQAAAINYAKSQVIKQFASTKLHKNEQINEIQLLSIQELERSWQVNLLINVNQNIAYFIPY